MCKFKVYNMYELPLQGKGGVYMRGKVEENEQKIKQKQEIIAHTQNSYMWSYLCIYKQLCLCEYMYTHINLNTFF